MTPSAVLIVAHEPLFRDGLRRALEGPGEFVVAGELGSTAAALEHCQAQRPAAVLLDTSPALVLTREALRGFTGACAAPVVAMVHCPLAGLFALAEGAHGIWSRSTGADLLLEAVRAATRGEIWVEAETMYFLSAEVLDRDERAQREARLTDHEREILSLLQQCADVHGLAGRLFTSPHTIKTHLRHRTDKLSLHDRGGLRRYAEERSLRASVLDGCLKTLQAGGAQIGAHTLPQLGMTH
jgi:DNA-binding NarL/FixJ family response regulator